MVANLMLEVGKFLLGRKVAPDQQIGRFQEGAMLRQVFNTDAPVF